MLIHRILLLAAFVLVPLALADHDMGPCPTVEPDVDTGETPAGRFYVINDECQPECIFSLWIYQESNGREGFQRGGEIDDCRDPDTIVF